MALRPSAGMRPKGWTASWVLAAALLCCPQAARGSPVLHLSRPAGAARTLLARGISQDASCPEGFLCLSEACPAGVLCPPGEECINFEGNLACAPPERSWCALSPLSLEAVSCEGDGICCHGNCYTSDAVCCDNPSVVCQVGSPCNVCRTGQTCATGATTCLGDGSSSSTAAPLPPSSPSSSPSPPSATGSSIPVGTASGTGTATSTTSTTPTPPITSPPPPTTTATIPAAPSSSSTDGAGSSGTATGSTSQQTPTATVVPGVGTFQNFGCWADDPGSRSLQGDSLEDDGGGMTVERCVRFAADGSWRFAGVELGARCFVGNTFRNDPVFRPPSECDRPCGGDAGQICGGASSMQLYVDGSWFLPSRDQVVASLQQYNASIHRAWDTIHAFQAAVGQFQGDVGAACGAASSSRQKRQSCELTPLLRSDSFGVQSSGSASAHIESTISSFTSELGRLFRLGAYRDLEGSTAALVTSDELIELQDMADTASASLSSISRSATSAAKSAARSLRAGVVPDFDPAEILQGVQQALSKLGSPANVAAGIIATAVFADVASLISKFVASTGSNSPPPPPPVPPPPRPPAAPSQTATATSSAASCQATPLPTDVIVVLAETATPGDYANLLTHLKSQPEVQVEAEINYLPSLPYWAFLAAMDDCTLLELAENPVVETVSMNAPVLPLGDQVHDVDDDASPQQNAAAQRPPPPPSSSGNVTQHAASRAAGHASIDAREVFDPDPAGFNSLLAWKDIQILDAEGNPVHGSLTGGPWHLDFLSTAFFSWGLAGTTTGVAGEDYRFTPKDEAITQKQNSIVFVIDSGVLGSHQEFAEVTNFLHFDCRDADAPCEGPSQQGVIHNGDPHGTAVAGVVAGRTVGVNKNALLASLTDADVAFSVVHAATQALEARRILEDGDDGIPGLAGIINLSTTTRYADLRPPELGRDADDGFDPWPRLLNMGFAQNTVFVVAASNTALQGTRLAELTPQRYGDRDNVIVVGNCGMDGLRADDSAFQDDDDVDRLALYAPGTHVLTAGVQRDNQYAYWSGTSLAAPVVSGLLTLLFAQMDVEADDVKAVLLRVSTALKGRDLWPADAPGLRHPRAALPAPYVSTCALGPSAPTATLKDYAPLGFAPFLVPIGSVTSALATTIATAPCLSVAAPTTA